MPCRATQDARVMVERSSKMWFTGKGKDKALQYSCLENPINSMKRQKDRTLKDQFPELVGARYGTGDHLSDKMITPERVTRQVKAKNTTQLWM